MPDFEHAVILLAVTAALVEVLKILVGATLAKNARALVGVVLLASFAATFVLRYSLWAHSQVIEGKPLDELPTSHLITAAVILWLVEIGVYLLGKKAGVGAANAVANIGFNQPTPVVIPPTPVAAPESVPDFTGDNQVIDPDTLVFDG